MTCARAEELISRRLDGALTGREGEALRGHLASCGACINRARALAAQDLLLARAWPPIAAPAGFSEAVQTALPAHLPGRAAPRRFAPFWTAPRPALAAALVIALLAVVAAPRARATLAPALRHFLLNEREPSPPLRLMPVQTVSLNQAQAVVDWRIRTPSGLPDGYRLAGVSVGALHSFARGPSVILHYQRGEGGDASELAIIELRANGRADEPVAPGASSAVTVGERPAQLIDGEWIEENGAIVWRRGALLRLVLEDGDLLIQLQADPRAGWDAQRLIAVADSLH